MEASIRTDPMERVLIVGATSAIATEVAVRYARRGASLFLIGRSKAKLTSLCTRLGAAVVGWEPADLNDIEHNAALVNRAIGRLGGLDTALIAHGLLGDQRVTEQNWSAAEEVLSTNLASPVSLLMPLAEHFESQGSGHIAVLSSVAGDRGRPMNYTYGAAKAGLNSITRSFAFAYGPKVRVNCIVAGPFLTDISKAWDMDAFRKFQAPRLALKRGGEPNEIVGAALYLASPASTFTTGTLIRVDGGTP